LNTVIIAFRPAKIGVFFQLHDFLGWELRVAQTNGCGGDNGGITLSPGFCATIFADNLGHANNRPPESNANPSPLRSPVKLVRGGVLPEPLYRLAVATFGQHGTNEMIYLVGLYSMVSTTLNGYNVPVPERE
jgi:hypothetical protein